MEKNLVAANRLRPAKTIKELYASVSGTKSMVPVKIALDAIETFNPGMREVTALN